jgi:AcrR family transcriptional regulator
LPGTYHSPLRARAAAETRAAIVDAASSLFVERGYASVTVSAIAAQAGVAVPTVYSSTGGKAEILAAIFEPMVEGADVRETLERVRAAVDPGVVIDTLGERTRRAHERHWGVLPALVDTCRAEPTAAAVLARGIEEYVRVLTVVAERLDELGALRPGFDRAATVDVLWFYLGQDAWLTLVGRRGWDFGRAQEWLTSGARQALLVPHDGQAGG